MKIKHLSTTEYAWQGQGTLATARIEVYTDDPNQHYAYEVGKIEVYDNRELFGAVREVLENAVEPTHVKIWTWEEAPLTYRYWLGEDVNADYVMLVPEELTNDIMPLSQILEPNVESHELWNGDVLFAI